MDSPIEVLQAVKKAAEELQIERRGCGDTSGHIFFLRMGWLADLTIQVLKRP